MDALQEVDALITTPSTLMIEGMLAGLPVAVLDYGNAPAYYAAAWRITAPRHVPEVLRSLRTPSQAEWLFQEYALHDMCACATPATPRLLALMARMIACGQEARDADAPLSFPARILPPDSAPIALPDNAFELARLYPEHGHLRRTQIAALHYEVALLRQIVGSRESDLNKFDRALKSFDAEVTARHQAVSSFERDLLTFKDELARRSADNDAREDRTRRWWHAGESAWLSVPTLVASFVAALPVDRPVYCWGAGEMGRRFLATLGASAARIDALLDGSEGHPTDAWGKPVADPSVLWDESAQSRPFVLVATMHTQKMAHELESHGFRPGVDYVCVPPLA